MTRDEAKDVIRRASANLDAKRKTMTDIVDRLRKHPTRISGFREVMDDAADEIERLRDAPRLMKDRERLIDIIKANSSSNMTEGACDSQAERIVDALLNGSITLADMTKDHNTK